MRRSKKLQTSIHDCEAESSRVRAQAEDDRKAMREASRVKTGLERINLEADRAVKRLKRENERLENERKSAESRALAAEGRAKGLQDQLVVIQKKVDHWEALQVEMDGDARNAVLSAYLEHQPWTNPSKDVDVSVLVDELRKKNAQLQTDIEQWRQVWKEAATKWDAREQGMRLEREEKQTALDTEKQRVLDAENANSRTTLEQDDRERDLRRQFDVEKQNALAEERKACRIQMELLEFSLRGQAAAAKLRSLTNKGRHNEHRNQMKVKKCQLKWVFKRAVSQAVMVERSLMQTEFRNHFQTQLANYKTKFESEHANSPAHPGAQNDKAPTATGQALHEEIQKRDTAIEAANGKLKAAIDEKQDLEFDIKTAKAEIERLSGVSVAYESQKSLAQQTKSETQINFVVQELVRAQKLLDEIATMGLDEKHRNILSEILWANKVVKDIRSTIENNGIIDYQYFHDRLGRIIDDSDNIENPDDQERPALEAHFVETYRMVWVLIRILERKRGEHTKTELLEQIYGGNSEKKKQSAISGSNSASGPSNVSSTKKHNSEQTLGTQPSPNPPQPDAAEHQNEPEEIDAATAHVLQGNYEADQGTSNYFDLDSIDWSDPWMLNFNP